jgi:hypothetical protein
MRELGLCSNPSIFLAAKGNRNAFKHGRYTAEVIASRREVAALIFVPCAPWPLYRGELSADGPITRSLST